MVSATNGRAFHVAYQPFVPRELIASRLGCGDSAKRCSSGLFHGPPRTRADRWNDSSENRDRYNHSTNRAGFTLATSRWWRRPLATNPKSRGERSSDGGRGSVRPTNQPTSRRRTGCGFSSRSFLSILFFSLSLSLSFLFFFFWAPFGPVSATGGSVQRLKWPRAQRRRRRRRRRRRQRRHRRQRQTQGQRDRQKKPPTRRRPAKKKTWMKSRAWRRREKCGEQKKTMAKMLEETDPGHGLEIAWPSNLASL